MFSNTYRKKLIIIFTIIAIIPILLFAASTYTKINTYIVEENIKAKNFHLESEAEKLDIWFTVNAEKISDLSANYPLIKELMIQTDGKKRVNEYLSSLLKSSKEIINIRIVTENSEEYSSKPILSSGDPRLKHDYINALLKKELVWTLQGGEYDTPGYITASIPFFDKEEKIEGALLVDFSFEGIFKRITEIETEGNSIKYVLNRQGKVLNVSGDELIDIDKAGKHYEKNISSLAWEIAYTDSGTKNITLDQDYLAIFSTVPSTSWKIVSLIPKSNIYSGMNVLIKDVIYVSAISFVFIILLSMMISKVFTEPLEKLKEGAIEIQNGNYDYKFNIKKDDEFGQVALSFNDMASKLKKSYEDLNSNNEMLLEINEQLQDMNVELEASYNQLMATTEQLNESEQKFRTLIGNMYDLVWIMDSDYNVVFANEQIESVLKTNKENFVGSNLETILSYVTENKEELYNEIISSDLRNKEISFANRQGHRSIVEANTKRVIENDRLVAIHGVIRDITSRKEMEENLKRKNEELVVINRVSRGLTTTMNIETLAQRAADGITRLMDVPVCTIRLLDEDRLKLKAYSGDASDLITLEDIPIDEDDIGKVAKTGRLHIFEVGREYKKSRYTERIIDSNKINYLNTLPIKARGKISGVMVVGSQRSLEKGEFHILASISNQIALIAENIALYEGLKQNYIKTIKTLAAAIEAKDEYTEGHSYRVSKYSLEISKYMGMPKKFCEEIEVAGILHDIGKLGIKDGVLTKPGRLTEKEYEMIRRHPLIGSKILEVVGFSDVIMNGIKFHHKRYDLKGYPEEIYIDELPLEAAIIGVADAFDAMTTNRAYKNAITPKEAIEELIQNKNTQFHPYIVDIMSDLYKSNKSIIDTIIESDAM
ncbi:PAS domain S-box-containing protein [Proteiniborus ethanoligenes]|uniref:PAS domain S-box-containing protein n=1 Tax=Proteiniborus ethanoligenes TaxID=415015 RepID=A0A1H3NRS7_9FIRM|nr:HD domain-containing phosphohydrolase [Proteiniborus ethanoligenes]SDY91390.1 PAS domain S-box-containing protein [Proteiniborus ethanoligenes]